MTLWESRDADSATGGRSTRGWRASGVSIDSRAVEPGDLFVALKDNRDGHDFVADAFKAGASAAMVERMPKGLADGAPLLIVEEVQAALERLGAAGRARSSAKVIAVTGSAGKTSSKEMLSRTLGFQGRTHSAEKSFNNHWGVPLTLARLPADAEFAVIEIGMNQPGEIEPLSRMARPHAALVTLVAGAHLAAFRGIEEIAEEKAAVFLGLEPNGTAVVHAEASRFRSMGEAAVRAGARTVTFGSADGADYRLVDVKVLQDGTVARALACGRTQFLKLAAHGRHFAENALGVLATVDAVGADSVIAALDLHKWAPPDGRGARHTVRLDRHGDQSISLMDDAFNANPASLSASLEVLAAAVPGPPSPGARAGRRVAVLGDMLELGRSEADLHAGFARHPSMKAISVVHCAGPLMRSLHDALPSNKKGCWCGTADDLARKAHSLAGPGDVVLVKGSKGSKISLVAAAIRRLGNARAQEGEEAT